MKYTPNRLMLSLLVFPLIGGCSSGGGFPSLAPRAAEKSPWVVTDADTARAADQGRITGSRSAAPSAPDTVVSQAPVSAELATRLKQLENSARAAHERFVGKRPVARQLVAAARGTAIASEAWSIATVAVADLESARSDAMVSLGELDRMYVAQRIDGGNGTEIAAVRDQVTAWVTDEDAVLADLGNRLGG